MSDELREKIEETATNPHRVRTDAGEVESHKIDELIELDKYTSAKTATAKKNRGLRFNKIIPPGT